MNVTSRWAISILLAGGCVSTTSGTATGPAYSQPDTESAAPPASAPCEPVVGNDQVARLPPGTCQGDLEVSGNSNQVIGAGIGQTFVEGALLVTGNDNQVHGVTVIGRTELTGNGNDGTGNELRGEVQDAGNDNKH